MVLAAHKDPRLTQPNRSNWHLADGDFVEKAQVDDIQADNDLEKTAWNKSDDAIYVRAVTFTADGTADRGPMLDTLADIAAQGEGWTDTTTSHFHRFLDLFEKFRAGGGRHAAPRGQGAHRSEYGAPRRAAPPPDDFIANPEANLWAQDLQPPLSHLPAEARAGDGQPAIGG